MTSATIPNDFSNQYKQMHTSLYFDNCHQPT